MISEVPGERSVDPVAEPMTSGLEGRERRPATVSTRSMGVAQGKLEGILITDDSMKENRHRAELCCIAADLIGPGIHLVEPLAATSTQTICSKR